IRVLKCSPKQINQFLRQIKKSPRILFDSKTWERMHVFVRVIPRDDILPSRSKYSMETNDWQVALNYLSASRADRNDALWYSLPDVVASVLLTNRIPRVVDVFLIQPHGVHHKVKRQIRLRGTVQINPREEDFFRVIVEQRQLQRSRTDISDIER